MEHILNPIYIVPRAAKRIWRFGRLHCGKIEESTLSKNVCLEFSTSACTILAPLLHFQKIKHFFLLVKKLAWKLFFLQQGEMRDH